MEEWKKRDPISNLRQPLMDQNLLVQDDIDEIVKKADQVIQDAVDFAEAGTWEPLKSLTRYVYSEKFSQP